MLWRGFLLLGAFNTALSYHGIKNAFRGNSTFDLRKACIVLASLLIACALSTPRGGDDVWHALASVLPCSEIHTFVLMSL
ncbi:hypothetical protein B0H17DRAFT_1197679 [Mycena rosella]|uniref:Uncharacterized protein n=1 Tax=Mycena rosella TaxID=1033263 RepID=A0AAD7DQU0_MYCRO|nr:hypothetical protein B0H17DRAFT_1197679 [Mycena rosella]